nr:hypothetical protein [Deltaproteobacteria bacterium]
MIAHGSFSLVHVSMKGVNQLRVVEHRRAQVDELVHALHPREHPAHAVGAEVVARRAADKAKDPTIDGLTQLDGYLARIGVGEGWLVLFDQRKSASALPERQAVEAVTTAGGRRVKVVRL